MVEVLRLGEILGPNALHYGLRQSPIFVGQSDRLGRELLHYIAPPFEEVSSILAALQALLKRTQGLSPVARAALVSFGFVYLHPMIDGNGRISRFLINDILRRDGALPAPYIARSRRSYLRPLTYDAARDRLKTIIEGPDPALDRIIRSVRESRGTISGKLRKEHPLLERSEIAEEIVRAIREEFPWPSAGDSTTKVPEQST